MQVLSDFTDPASFEGINLIICNVAQKNMQEHEQVLAYKIHKAGVRVLIDTGKGFRAIELDWDSPEAVSQSREYDTHG